LADWKLDGRSPAASFVSPFLGVSRRRFSLSAPYFCRVHRADARVTLTPPSPASTALSGAGDPRTVAGLILNLVLFVVCLIPEIMGAVKAGTGEGFRYPVRIPFVLPTVGPR